MRCCLFILTDVSHIKHVTHLRYLMVEVGEDFLFSSYKVYRFKSHPVDQLEPIHQYTHENWGLPFILSLTKRLLFTANELDCRLVYLPKVGKKWHLLYTLLFNWIVQNLYYCLVLGRDKEVTPLLDWCCIYTYNIKGILLFIRRVVNEYFDSTKHYYRISDFLIVVWRSESFHHPSQRVAGMHFGDAHQLPPLKSETTISATGMQKNHWLQRWKGCNVGSDSKKGNCGVMAMPSCQLNMWLVLKKWCLWCVDRISIS